MGERPPRADATPGRARWVRRAAVGVVLVVALALGLRAALGDDSGDVDNAGGRGTTTTTTTQPTTTTVTAASTTTASPPTTRPPGGDPAGGVCARPNPAVPQGGREGYLYAPCDDPAATVRVVDVLPGDIAYTRCPAGTDVTSGHDQTVMLPDGQPTFVPETWCMEYL